MVRELFDYNSIYDLSKEIKKFAFEVETPNSENITEEQRIRISLNLLAAISNLSMGTQARQIRLFNEAEKIKIHILRPKYYSPLPILSELSENIWTKNEETGINWNEKLGLSLLKQLKPYGIEYEKIIKTEKFNPNNPAFVNHDPVLYYSFIRHFKPKKIFEVGGGFSTQIAALACLENQQSELTCIEPFPQDFLEDGFPGLYKLIKKPVQEIPVSKFLELGKNDILFVDSTHVSKIGSDVNYLFLEVFPQLNPGVLIHIHDIHLPQQWPYEFIKLHLFWNEQFLLHAFLIGNSDFEVVLGNHYMKLRHPEALKQLYDNNPIGGGSFWMRKIN